VKGEGQQQDYGMRVYDPRLGKFLSVDPSQKRYPSLTPYAFVANCPLFYIDPDGRDIIPSASFMNSPYYALYNELKANNTAFITLVDKFATSKSFNLVLDWKDEDVPNGFTAITNSCSGPGPTLNPKYGTSIQSYAPRQYSYQIEKKSHISTYALSEIAAVSKILHESLHSYLAVKRDPEEKGTDHIVFGKNINLVVDGLKEYNKKKNLGFGDDQLYELAIWGVEDLVTDHMKKLAEKNGTTVDAERKNYDKRVVDISWERTKVEPKENVSSDSSANSSENSNKQ
jgi:RHS repeat-associated protein